MNSEKELILRRLTEQFPDWYVALPVLFALMVLFIMACLRQDKGIGTLLLGFCLLPVVWLTMGYSYETYGGNQATEILLKFGLGGLMVGGFIANLLREFRQPAAVFWTGGALGMFLHMGWVVMSERITEGMKEPLPVQMGPALGLFLIQCVVSAQRARLTLGLAVIAVLSVIYVPFALQLKPAPSISWWVILAPVLTVALFYVAMMYIQDAKTIHWLWAGFLGLLRCTVYAIFAFVFLLPGQQSFNTNVVYPKVLVLFDVSDSMNWKDELGKPGQTALTDKRLSRQDKVLAFLTATTKGPDGADRKPWMDRLLDKSPATIYRFGQKLDERNVGKLFAAEEKKADEEKKTDDEDKAVEEKRPWTVAEWKKFLFPGKDIQISDEEKEFTAGLLRGTNVAGAANLMSKIEAGNYVQAIVIISDGRSNTGSEQELVDFLGRVNNPSRKIHVFTVGVGDYKQPVEIRIDEMQAPQTVRPDEKFPLYVPVVASKGLRDQQFELILEARRTRDNLQVALAPSWWSRRTLPVSVFPPRKAKFKGEGDYPKADVAFEKGDEIDLVRVFMQREKGLVQQVIGKDNYESYEKEVKQHEPELMLKALIASGVDASAMTKDMVKGAFMERFIEGDWEFTARVKRNDDEVFEDEFHVSQPPARVQVRNKKPRILLFAGQPTRDYQFVRTLLARESQAKRIELCVYLQTGGRLDGVDQDVPNERLLSHFPHRRGPDDPKDKFSSINMFDLIIAFDADWGALNANLPEPADPSKKISNADQARLVTNWVGREGGGIIFVAGPVNTYQLSAASPDLGTLPNLVPVVLKDFRLSPDLGIKLKRPYMLTFTDQARTVDFLQLDNLAKAETPPGEKAPVESKGAFYPSGWQRFFGELERNAEDPDDDMLVPERGFFSYYPVEAKRADSMILATFNGPPKTYVKINNVPQEQPYLVTMKFESGKTVYIGGSESWRLRQFKESYHDSFWLNLMRFAAGGSANREKFGRFVAAPRAQVGNVAVEIQIKEAVAMKGEKEGQADVLVPGGYLPREGVFKPKIYLRKNGEDKDLAEFSLRAKSSDGPWMGWFEGKVAIKEPGDYVLVNKIFAPGEATPLTSEVLSHQINVTEPKLEDADLREDFDPNLPGGTATALMNLATDAETVAERMKGELDGSLPARRSSAEGRKLFFRLDKADRIPDCLYKLEPRTQRTLAGIQDLWDQGASLPLFLLLWTVSLGLFTLAGAILLFHQKWIAGSIALALAAAAGLTALISYAMDMPILQDAQPVDFAFVLVSVVSLLALEWLTRKLLRLA